MTCKWNFEIFKIEKVKTALSTVKEIVQRFVNKGTENRKVGSGRARASTIKHHHRLKMNVLKGIRKRWLSPEKNQNSKKKLFC